MRLHILLVGLGALVNYASAVHAAPQYTVTVLGDVFPNGINNTGQIVGWRGSLPVQTSSPYSSVVDLSGNGSDGAAEAINSHGVAVGKQINSAGQSHAFSWSSSGSTDLGTLGGADSNALGINDLGRVVGTSRDSAGNVRAFYYDGTVMTQLVVSVGTATSASDINNAGQIVGLAVDSGGLRHAFLYDGGTTIDLGSASSGIGVTDLNDLGQVVGLINNRAFFYDGSTLIDLGTLGGDRSDAQGVNNSGVIVGEARIAIGSSQYHAFVSYGTGMIDLNTLIPPTPGLLLERAGAINDAGQIAANGELNGQNAFFLLTPVPEPHSSALALIGCICVWLARKRRASA